MKYFVQLKDDVVFAYHSSSTEVDIPGDNIIEVESDGEKHLNKKYENGNFVDAPLIKYAVLENNTVVSIDKTLYSSEVNGPIVDDTVKIMATWDGTSFSNPEVVSPPVNVPVEVIINEIAPVVFATEFIPPHVEE
jgi:hypothetical protein